MDDKIYAHDCKFCVALHEAQDKYGNLNIPQDVRENLEKLRAIETNYETFDEWKKRYAVENGPREQAPWPETDEEEDKSCE